MEDWSTSISFLLVQHFNRWSCSSVQYRCSMLIESVEFALCSLPYRLSTFSTCFEMLDLYGCISPMRAGNSLDWVCSNLVIHMLLDLFLYLQCLWWLLPCLNCYLNCIATYCDLWKPLVYARKESELVLNPRRIWLVTIPQVSTVRWELDMFSTVRIHHSHQTGGWCPGNRLFHSSRLFHVHLTKVIDW